MFQKSYHSTYLYNVHFKLVQYIVGRSDVFLSFFRSIFNDKRKSILRKPKTLKLILDK